jgi:ABC-type multidrug transport system ATPase subunit
LGSNDINRNSFAMKLEFDGIEFRYTENPLLSGIYVKCETGRISGLLGRNGTGKSTLLKIVFGSLKTDVKSVRVDGKYLESAGFSSRMVSYMPQDSFIPHFLTLKQILKLYKVKAETVVAEFPEFEEMLDKSKNALSGGMVRLFENLLILCSPSPFAFFDEPFSGLSPVMIERLINCMMKEKLNKGILVTDHLYRHVTNISDDLFVLASGKTYHAKNKDELIRRGYLLDDAE